MANNTISLILSSSSSNTGTVFVVALLLCVSAAAIPNKLHPPAPANSICKSLVEKQGYVCQQHQVTTKDGYILGLQRIPMGRFRSAIANMTVLSYTPVLLQHGLFVDATTWLLGSPNEARGFILADNGFDVWLSNTRGTASSRGHASVLLHDPAYWEWTWDELLHCDPPALFHYVQDRTGQRLHYIGHSLGTLTALGALSEGKLLNMLRSALLSPVAYLGQIPSPISRIIAQLFLADDLYLLGVREFNPNGSDVNELIDFACNKLGIDCSRLELDILTGPNCCLKTSTVNALFEYEPQSTSTKNIMHLSRVMIRRGNIAKNDYGNEYENAKKYGQPTPPIHNIASIANEVPLFLSHGGEDIHSDVNDVQVLLDHLTDHDPDKLVVQYKQEYAHLDFIIGFNANQLVYDPLY